MPSSFKAFAPFVVSFILHLGLILYAHHVDTHPQRFGGLKYTDIDWRVVSDGAGYIFGVIPGKRASGWLTSVLRLPIGDPYERATFRYTPLLPLILSPTLLHPLIGKLVLSTLSLLVPFFLLSGPRRCSYWPTHLLWTLNPFVLNITTRGSPESIIILLVVCTFYYLRKSDQPGTLHRDRYQDISAFLWALSVSWKIYPIIYGVAIWTFLAGRYGWFARACWRFGIVAMVSFVGVNLVLWSIWGEPFLRHTFLYHLTRRDHRHNFSPYFYPIYLSSFPSDSMATSTLAHLTNRLWRNPLFSFIPQFGLVSFAGLELPQKTGMEFTVFIQTVIFVVFNKVCTSQYFIWFIPLLIPIVSRFNLSKSQSITLIASWIISQAVWLYTAFRLELLGESVYRSVWLCGLGVMLTSTWILGKLMDSYIVLGGSSVVSSKRAGFGQEVKIREKVKIG